MGSFVVAVAAVVFDGERVLAMRRAATKDAGAGLWETLSGRVEPGEQPLDALTREIDEECGLAVRVDPRPVDAYVARRNEEPMLVVVYRADRVSGEVRRSEEHDAHAWWTPAELRARSTLTRLVDAVDRAAALGLARAGSSS
jgi:8-oxo-dGTP diphosphatase